MPLEPKDANQKQCDEALAAWRQGDYVLGDFWFAFGVNPGLPITDDSAFAAATGETLIQTQQLGFVVTTQTCDIVGGSAEKPYVDVSPLVEIPEALFDAVKSHRYPRYAPLAGLDGQRLAADLSRTMTLEKSVLVGAVPAHGCTTDGESRAFAMALSRKASRFAFPDDLHGVFKKLRDRISKKHGKDSPAGKAIDALGEIRVTAYPNWDAAQVQLTVWFIKDSKAALNKDEWGAALKDWSALIEPSGRYTTTDPALLQLSEITAAEYLGGERLDLDNFSPEDN